MVPEKSRDFPLHLPFASESRIEIFTLTLSLIVAIIWTIVSASLASYCALVLIGSAWIVITYFFRDPERKIPSDVGVYLSPADGKIMVIDIVDEPLFVKNRAKRIAIFMSLTDVHVNRAPVDGEVVLSRYVPGKFLQAFREEASTVNEHHLIGLVNERSRVLVKQIAGILARRVVCRVSVGDQIEAGDRLGIIKFSSRVEIFMPLYTDVLVRVGDRVKAGESIIARSSQNN